MGAALLVVAVQSTTAAAHLEPADLESTATRSGAINCTGVTAFGWVVSTTTGWTHVTAPGVPVSSNRYYPTGGTRSTPPHTRGGTIIYGGGGWQVDAFIISRVSVDCRDYA